MHVGPEASRETHYMYVRRNILFKNSLLWSNQACLSTHPICNKSKLKAVHVIACRPCEIYTRPPCHHKRLDKSVSGSEIPVLLTGLLVEAHIAQALRVIDGSALRQTAPQNCFTDPKGLACMSLLLALTQARMKKLSDAVSCDLSAKSFCVFANALPDCNRWK